jgi:hypothetical protein
MLQHQSSYHTSSVYCTIQTTARRAAAPAYQADTTDKTWCLPPKHSHNRQQSVWQYFTITDHTIMRNVVNLSYRRDATCKRDLQTFLHRSSSRFSTSFGPKGAGCHDEQGGCSSTLNRIFEKFDGEQGRQHDFSAALSGNIAHCAPATKLYSTR